MAKHGMYDICFQEVLSFSEKINPALCRVFRKIRSVHTSLFQLVPEIVKEAVEVQKERDGFGVDQITAELHRSEEETGQLLEAAEMLESEAKVNQAELMKVRSAASVRAQGAKRRSAANIAPSQLVSSRRGAENITASARLSLLVRL